MKFITIILDCYAYFYNYRIKKLNKKLNITKNKFNMIKYMLNLD